MVLKAVVLPKRPGGGEGLVIQWVPLFLDFLSRIKGMDLESRSRRGTPETALLRV